MFVTDDGFDMQALPRRPGSSRYHVLPPIGQTSHTESSTDETHLDTALDGQKAQQTAEPSDRENVDTRSKLPMKSHSRLHEHIKMASEHGLNVECKSPVNQGGRVSKTSEPPVPLDDQQVVLAVKLPSGQRIEHHFRSTQKLSEVLHYVAMTVQQDFTNCTFFSADRTTVLTDLNLTIASSGVLSRSVLFLQLPDET